MLVALRLIFFALIAPPILLAVILFFATDTKPEVNISWSLTRQDILRAQKILNGQASNQDGVIKTLELNEKDLNIAANHLINRYLKSASRIRLIDNGLLFSTSITLPNNLINPFLNIDFTLTQHGQLPMISHLTLGRFVIPEEYAGRLIEAIIKNSALKKYYILASKHIRGIQITESSVRLSYFWSQETYSKAHQLLIDSPHNDAIIFYQHKLAEIVVNHDRKWRLSLATLLRELFKEAIHRSEYFDAIKENQAIIFVVSAYVNQQNVQALLPNIIISPISNHSPAYLYKRIDTAQHFMASATLTAFGNAHLTHLMGQQKELHDARKGSGFSFIDLAADRAGIRFGETATDSVKMARKLQKIMAQISDYKAFMPDVRHLPENMTTAHFVSQYESIYSEPYQNQLKQIDKSIAACAIYKGL